MIKMRGDTKILIIALILPLLLAIFLRI